MERQCGWPVGPFSRPFTAFRRHFPVNGFGRKCEVPNRCALYLPDKEVILYQYYVSLCHMRAGAGLQGIHYIPGARHPFPAVLF